MNEYLNFDPAGMSNWYAANAARLRPEQNERIALAFARAANTSGDKLLARGWQKQITDPQLAETVAREIGD
jgi:hypothetical protein